MNAALCPGSLGIGTRKSEWRSHYHGYFVLPWYNLCATSSKILNLPHSLWLLTQVLPFPLPLGQNEEEKLSKSKECAHEEEKGGAVILILQTRQKVKLTVVFSLESLAFLQAALLNPVVVCISCAPACWAQVCTGNKNLFPLQAKLCGYVWWSSLGCEWGAVTQPREAACGIAWLPCDRVRSEPHVSSAVGQPEPSLLPAEPPAFAAAACNGHRHQLLIPWPGTSIWNGQEVLGVAVLLGECCRVASNGAWKSCKSETRPARCVETQPCFWCLFFHVSLFLLLTALNSRYCLLLPWGCLAQLMPHELLCSWQFSGPLPSCPGIAE